MEGKSTGRIGYVTGREGSLWSVRWVRNTCRSDLLSGDTCAGSFLKHYLRPGDLVRCLNWPEMPSTWFSKAGMDYPIGSSHPLDSRLVTEIEGIPMVNLGNDLHWPLAHVEKVWKENAS